MKLLKEINDESKIIQLKKRKPTPNNVDENSLEIDGINTKDYPDFADAYLSAADWKDTGEPLTDEELEELQQNYGDWFYEKVYNQAMQAMGI